MSDAYWMGLNTINSFNNANLNTFNQNMGNAAANQYAMIGSPPPYQSPVAFGDYNYGTVGGYPSFGDPIYPGYGPRGGTGTPDTAEQPFSPSGGAGGYTPLPSNTFDERFPMANAGETSVFNNPNYFPQQYPDVIGNGGYPTLDQRWQPLNEPYYNQPLNDALFQRGSGAQIGPQVEPGRFTAPPSQERLAPETGYPDFSNEQFPLEAMDRWRQSMNAMQPMPQARPADAPSSFDNRWYQPGVPTPQSRPESAPGVPFESRYAEVPPQSTFDARWPMEQQQAPAGGWSNDFRNAIARQMMQQQEAAYNGTNLYGDPSRGMVGSGMGDPFSSYPYQYMNADRQVQNRFPTGVDLGSPSGPGQQQILDAERTLQELLGNIDRASGGGQQEYPYYNSPTPLGPSDRGLDYYYGQ